MCSTGSVMKGGTIVLVLDDVYRGNMCVMVTVLIVTVPVVMDLMRTQPSASHGMYVTIVIPAIIHLLYKPQH